MRTEFTKCENREDENGMPAGGEVRGRGLRITWQDGPLGRDEERIAPNGAFVEDVIEAARQRIRFYQDTAGGRFSCGENEVAIRCLEEALEILDSRTTRRESAGTEGTHAEEQPAKPGEVGDNADAQALIDSGRAAAVSGAELQAKLGDPNE